jgi:hypothetical protein
LDKFQFVNFQIFRSGYGNLVPETMQVFFRTEIIVTRYEYACFVENMLSLKMVLMNTKAITKAYFKSGIHTNGGHYMRVLLQVNSSNRVAGLAGNEAVVM